MTTSTLPRLRRIPRLITRHEAHVVRALHKASHGWRLRLSEILLVLGEERTGMRFAARAFAERALPLVEVPRTETSRGVTIGVFDPATAPYVLDELPFANDTDARPRGTIMVVAEHADGRMLAGSLDVALLPGFSPAPLPVEPRSHMDFGPRYLAS